MSSLFECVIDVEFRCVLNFVRLIDVLEPISFFLPGELFFLAIISLEIGLFSIKTDFWFWTISGGFFSKTIFFGVIICSLTIFDGVGCLKTSCAGVPFVVGTAWTIFRLKSV